MGRYVQFDEFHLIILVPPDLEEPAGDTIRQAQDSQRFQSDLRRAVRQLIRSYPDLVPVRLRISR